MSHRKRLPGLNKNPMKLYLNGFMAIFIALATSSDLKANVRLNLKQRNLHL